MGDTHQISAQFVGMMAAAKDRKFSMTYVDRALGGWGPPSRLRLSRARRRDRRPHRRPCRHGRSQRCCTMERRSRPASLSRNLGRAPPPRRAPRSTPRTPRSNARRHRRTESVGPESVGPGGDSRKPDWALLLSGRREPFRRGRLHHVRVGTADDRCDWLPPSRVGQRLGVSPQTITAGIEAGRITARAVPRGTLKGYLISEDECARLATIQCSSPGCDRVAPGPSGRCGKHRARVKHPAEQRECEQCGVSMGTIPGSRIRDGRGRFCSKRCQP